MRYLICGLGSIGRRHLRNLVALGEEDILLYRTGKSTLPEEDLEGFPVERDLMEALSRHAPDAVLVTNPTGLHMDVALPAAEAGAHLFLEKPISDSADRIEQLKSLVAERSLRVLVGFQFRFHPGLREAKELLAQGLLGRPLSASAHWGEHLPNWHPWEDYQRSYSARKDLGGGVVLTLSHPFDYLHWLLGPVEAVSAEVTSNSPLDLEVEDCAEVLLRHQWGCLSRVHLDYNQRPTRHDLEIICSEGTLRWNAVTDTLRWWTLRAGEWQESHAGDGFERNELFLAEMRHFRAVLTGKEAPICSLAEGEHALGISLAALRSAETGERVNVEMRIGAEKDA